MVRRDLADQRDVFSFYLAVISYANWTCKVKTGEDVDESFPQNFFHSVSYVKTFADERLLANKLGISIYFSQALWASC